MLKKICKVLGIVLGALVLVIAGLLAWMTATEYKPAPVEPVDIVSSDESAGGSAASPSGEDQIRIMTWNIGYGALGDNADFFMDGGKGVMTADAERVDENMTAVISQLTSENPDIVLLQEVDQNSRRSHYADEVAQIRSSLSGYQSSYANNYKASFVPFPFPPLGKIDSGLLTLCRFETAEASRISLPCPFVWPVRTVNLKRGLLVSRIPLSSGTKAGRDLVIVNLHLEAYDSGAGKIAQTKVLLQILNEELEKGNYVIAGGDFNQTFSNIGKSNYPVLRGMWQPGAIKSSDFGARWSLRMDPAVPTCRSLDRPYNNLPEAAKDADLFQYYMIDGFILSDNLQVNSIKTKNLGFVNSDHNPVVMEFTLK